MVTANQKIKDMMVADRMNEIQPFHVMELLSRAQELTRAGNHVVHMEIGEPDFPAPRAVIERGVDFLHKGDVKYTSAEGLPELRAAVAAHYLRTYGVAIPPHRVFVTPGASGAFLLALAAMLNPGRELLLADPGYPCYANFARLFGGVPCAVPVGEDSGFQLTSALLDRHWSGRTSGVILASPSNPTGTVVSGESLRDMIELTHRRNGFFVSDEIYHGLEYGAASHTALEFSEQSFVINSFSKYFGMTGWRVGWLIAPEDCLDAVKKLAQNLFISAPAHSQFAALAAFDEDNLRELERRRQAFRERRDYLLTRLRELGFRVPVTPEGAFYVYADCSPLTANSFDFARRLLEQAHVAVTPGKDFGNHRPERYIRFSYTTSLENLKLGLDRIATFLAGGSLSR